MTTRILHRIDSVTNWATAQSEGAGKLAPGELALAYDSTGLWTAWQMRIGTGTTPRAFASCPLVARWHQDPTGLASTTPVIVDASAAGDGDIIAWDTTSSSWTIKHTALLLSELPTEDGVVLWDQGTESFVVGAAVSATDLDGGSY